MVDKAAKILKSFGPKEHTHKITSIAQVGKEPLVMPNYSGVKKFADERELFQTSGWTDDGAIVRLTTAGDSVGIGTASPDGKLHIFEGTAGAVTANTAGDGIIVEDNTDTGISILSPDGSFSNIFFGAASSNTGALIRWKHSTKIMQLGTNFSASSLQFLTDAGTLALDIDSSQNFNFQDGNIVTTGTLGAGVATLGDASLLASDAAPTTDAMIANKKYVDDNAGSGLWQNPSNGIAQLISGSDTISGSALELSGNLDVSGSATISGDLTVGDAAGDQILGVNGSEAAPTYSFQNDPNTGMSTVGVSDTIFFTTGGTSPFQIDSAGITVRIDGSKTAPCIDVGDDGNTGLFNPSIDILAFTAGAVEFCRFDEGTQDVAIFNEDGGDIDFRVESDVDPNAFFLDGATGNVAIGTSTVPTGSGSLMIANTASVPGTPTVSGSAIFASGSELWAIGGLGTKTRLAIA